MADCVVESRTGVDDACIEYDCTSRDQFRGFVKCKYSPATKTMRVDLVCESSDTDADADRIGKMLIDVAEQRARSMGAQRCRALSLSKTKLDAYLNAGYFLDVIRVPNSDVEVYEATKPL
jgi:hypothetical protein